MSFKILLFQFFILTATNLFSMESTPKKVCVASSAIGDDELVTFVSLDGQHFKVEVGVAKLAETLKHVMKDAGTDAPIPLPNITSGVLGKILELLRLIKDVHAKVADAQQKGKYVVDAVSSFDGPLLIDFIAAVNYLDVPGLLKLGIHVAGRRDINKLPASLLGLPKEIRNAIIFAQTDILGQVSIKESLVIEGPKTGKGVKKIIVTPDDKKIIAAFKDHTIRVYDIKTASRIAVFGSYNHFCITPDGTRIVQINSHGRVQISDINSKNLLEFNAMVFSYNSIRGIDITRDGSKIIVATYREIYILDITNGALIKTVTIEQALTNFGFNVKDNIQDARIDLLHISPRNNKLIFSVQNIIVELDITTLKITNIFECPRAYGEIHRIYIASDGSKIIGRVSKSLFEIDVRTKKFFLRKNHLDKPFTVTPDDKKIIVIDNPLSWKPIASNDPVIRIYDIKTLKELAVLQGHKPNNICVWVAKDGTSRQSLRRADITSVQVTQDGNYIISGSEDNSIRIWDISVFKLEPLIKNMSLEQAQQVFNYLKGDHAAGWDGIKEIFGFPTGHAITEASGGEPVLKKHKAE